MGSLSVPIVLSYLMLCILLHGVSSYKLAKEVEKLKGAQTLIQADIRQIKEKVWSEVVPDIEIMKHMIKADIGSNDTSEESQSDTLQQGGETILELKKKLEEEVGHRKGLEEMVKEQANNMAVLLSAVQDQKQQISSLSKTCDDLKNEFISEVIDLKQKDSLNEQNSHQTLQIQVQLDKRIVNVTGQLNELSRDVEGKAGKEEINIRLKNIQTKLSSDLQVLEDKVNMNEQRSSNVLNKSNDFDIFISKATDIHSELESKVQKCTTRMAKEAEKLKCFNKPDFISDWILMKSQDADLSEVTVAHGLGVLPYKVDVQIKPTQGPNAGWIFPGASASQSDDDYGTPYGGVVFFYNASHVLLQAPKENNAGKGGRIIYTGQDKSMYLGAHHQSEGEALVRVKVWGPESTGEPHFISSWEPLNIDNKNYSYYDIKHGLTEYPALVNVQVRCGTGSKISEGVGASMPGSAPYPSFGGVIWAVGKTSVRIWSSFQSKKHLLCGGQDGWGLSSGSQDISGAVRIMVWSRRQCLPGVSLFEQENDITQFLFKDSDYLAFYSQLNEGVNRGFRFFSYGNVQAKGSPFGGAYGGAIYAYNEAGGLRVWKPNPDTDGYMIHVGEPYGAGVNNQASNNVTTGVILIHALP